MVVAPFNMFNGGAAIKSRKIPWNQISGRPLAQGDWIFLWATENMTCGSPGGDCETTMKNLFFSKFTLYYYRVV